MKTIILLFFICSSVFGQENKSLILNFNGIYETKCNYANDDEGEKSFIRFFPNQKIISVGTDCDATVSDLKTWFNLEKKDISIGSYKIKNDKIFFSTTSASGTVEYKGKITENGILKLNVKSLINGYRSREEYQFIQMTDLK
ncbi:MAG: hypothetical protein QM535_11655 [Limnohabitans sp.]|nr:hypothetical protein [Limnohabitans sp.]